MENVEKKFLEAVEIESKLAQGYTLNFVKRSVVSLAEGEPPDVVDLEFVIPNSKVRLQFSLAISRGSFLGLRIYNKEGKFFSLNEYLGNHKRDDLMDKLFNHRRDFPTVMNQMIALFNGDMKGIITGKRWEDIPRDWMGYK